MTSPKKVKLFRWVVLSNGRRVVVFCGNVHEAVFAAAEGYGLAIGKDITVVRRERSRLIEILLGAINA